MPVSLIPSWITDVPHSTQGKLSVHLFFALTLPHQNAIALLQRATRTLIHLGVMHLPSSPYDRYAVPAPLEKGGKGG